MRRLLILLAVIAAVPCGATSPCPPPKAENLIIVYTGSTTGCLSFGGPPCLAGELITFEVKTFAYTFCEGQTVTWNFGDGSAFAAGRKITHAYASYGLHEVEATVTTWNHPPVRVRTRVEIGLRGDPPPPKRSRAVRH